MAKYNANAAPKVKKAVFPSIAGSHTSMIDEDETAKLEDPSKVALKDEKGVYVTDRRRLDSGLADVNRFNRHGVVE
jgi:hypothetical protein